MNIVIIEDEGVVADELERNIKQLVEEPVEIVQLRSVKEGIAYFKKAEAPDLIFSDIQLGDGDGFGLLEQLGETETKVIFTTGMDNYGIRAIKFSALDYLLKPVDRNELEQAIEKFKNEKDITVKEQVTHLQLFREKKIKDTIALSASQGLFFVKINDIMYLEGDNCYTHVMMSDGKKYLVSKTLANFDDILTEDNTFFRAHKSFVIVGITSQVHIRKPYPKWEIALNDLLAEGRCFARQKRVLEF